MTRLSEQFSKVKPGDVGIFGDPVDHSLSPLIQNAAFGVWEEALLERTNRIPFYHKFCVKKEELANAVETLRKKDLRGCNITIPHKIAVGNYVDQWDPRAKTLGAINTLLYKNGVLTGYNTDGIGFRRAVEWDLGLSLEGKRVVVLGAGGTGRVIVQMLLEMNTAEVFIWNRSSVKAEDLVEETKGSVTQLQPIITDEDLRRRTKEADFIINATSVGLKEKEGLPAPFLEFHPEQVAFDVIYHRETAFLKEAQRSGARTSGGEGMFLHQAALAFEIWTGSPAPLDVMRDVLMKYLKKGN